MQEGANADFLLKQKAGKCYTWHIVIDRNIYVFKFNQSAVSTSLAFSHATLNDSLLILQSVVHFS